MIHTFDPDVAESVGLKRDVAYMPVPRCDRCGWWKKFALELQPERIGGLANLAKHFGLSLRLPLLGDCTLFECQSGDQVYDEAKLELTRTGSGEGTVVTHADFGCVQWKAKEGESDAKEG